MDTLPFFDVSGWTKAIFKLDATIPRGFGYLTKQNVVVYPAIDCPLRNTHFFKQSLVEVSDGRSDVSVYIEARDIVDFIANFVKDKLNADFLVPSTIALVELIVCCHDQNIKIKSGRKTKKRCPFTHPTLNTNKTAVKECQSMLSTNGLVDRKVREEISLF